MSADVAFTVMKTDGRARRGRPRLSHGEIETVFMPVSTRAAIKGLTHDHVMALDPQIILANTNHLHPPPEARPRYPMGTGMPDDLVDCVARGIDLLDCVRPTRNARNGRLVTRHPQYRAQSTLLP